MNTVIEESMLPLTEFRSDLHLDEDSEIRTHILMAVEAAHECDLEDLVNHCSFYTWNQVFSEVDRMSRSGDLRLM